MLPKSDAADSEDTRSVTKTPSSALHEKRIVGSEVCLMGDGKEPERDSTGGAWGSRARCFCWLLTVF